MRLSAELGNNAPIPPNLPEGPSLMTQLQEDLGLKLDSRRGPGDVLVIDSAELPTPDWVAGLGHGAVALRAHPTSIIGVAKGARTPILSRPEV
jgi:hypothetical protein